MKLLLTNKKPFLFFFSCFCLFIGGLYGQTESFSVKDNTGNNQLYISNDGKVGIDTSTTLGSLTINGLDGIIATGTFGSGTALNLGAGTRFMWYPKKASLRAGYVDVTNWDDSNIGNYSIATGYNTKASAYYSTAMGINTDASGIYSTAIGNSTTASGAYSTAMGYYNSASGDYSTVMGAYITASGYYSTAMGYHTTASGNHSTAMGTYCSTNNYAGSFVIGDGSTTTLFLISSANDQMSMRFAGGYRFYTNSGATIGSQLLADGNSWTSISDSTKKENFIRADEEYFLNSLSKLRLGSWNYKTQDPTEFRHYGPMAQEIFHYFGRDELGTIGNDTTLATADMDGIIMICLQALEKRTEKLQNTSNKIEDLEKEITSLKEVIKNQNNVILSLKEEYSHIKQISEILLQQSKEKFNNNFISTTSLSNNGN
jgi:hypothetical protein